VPGEGPGSPQSCCFGEILSARSYAASTA
jgi:hypothetical protein